MALDFNTSGFQKLDYFFVLSSKLFCQLMYPQFRQLAVEQFIDQQAFDDATTARLKALTPATYTGVASKLVDFDR